MSEQLTFQPATKRPDLLARPVLAALAAGGEAAAEARVAEIDPEAADTRTFCERYGVSADESANCVVVAGRRAGETRMAACVVLSNARVDVNGVVRRQLEVRKASFAPIEVAVAETDMEYGGITPLGLPAGWPLLLDTAVAKADSVIVGSGVRRSKLRLPGSLLTTLPGASVVDGLGQ